MSELRELPSSDGRAGIDVVDIERFRAVLARRPAIIEKLFTGAEQDRCRRAADPVPHYAARFAAKEAVRKALGRAIAWHDCELSNDEAGAPLLRLRDGIETTDALSVNSASVSIAHDAGIAVAVVVLEVQRRQRR